MKFSKLLKELRVKNHISQDDLAKTFNISKSSISHYEQGKNYPKLEVLKKYSYFFNIPLETLTQAKEESQITNKLNDFKNNSKNDVVIECKEMTPNNFIQLIDNFDDYSIIEVPYFEGLSAGIECNVCDNMDQPSLGIFLKRNMYSSMNNLIAIRINGESMNKVLVDHSIAVIDKGADIKSGDIVAYQLGANEYGIKRIYDYPEYIKLCPESYDSIFKDKTILKENLDQEHFMVIGKLIKSISDDKTLKY